MLKKHLGGMNQFRWKKGVSESPGPTIPFYSKISYNTMPLSVIFPLEGANGIFPLVLCEDSYYDSSFSFDYIIWEVQRYF